jgi:uroporphyrinogen decarboxylase
MSLIEKRRETMTHRERVKRTFEFEKTDRVTIGYDTNEGIHGRLARALGIPGGDMELVMQALGVDYRGVAAPYVGPELFTAPEGMRVDPLEGCRMRWVPHEGGGYWDFCDFPLAGAEDEQFDTFPVPDPDDFDYDAALARAKSYGGQYGLYVGGAGTPDIINSNGRIMGMEDVLCHLIFGDEAAMRFIRRRADSQLKVMERTLEKCRGYIDFMWLGEDLGTQNAPMISLKLYRSVLKPIHKSFCDLAAAYGIPAMIHTCGSSSWAYEDFIEMGMRGVDTLQPEAADMSPRYLADRFGGRLCFRGCISTAGPLAYGTTQDVERNCKETLEIMMEHRGYHFAPTHRIQDNTPVENVIAMYNAAYRYGYY